MKNYDPKKLEVLHFQHRMYDLGNGYFEVLASDQFCNELQQYLIRLFDLGHNHIILNVLGKVGQCAANHERYNLRERAILVVTEFASILDSQKDKEFYQAVAVILTEWLKRVEEYYIGLENVFVRVEAIIRKMLSLQFWSQAETLLSAVHKKNYERMTTDKRIRTQVNKLHCGVADEKNIDAIIESFLKEKSPAQIAERKLLLALAPHSTGKMIQALCKSTKKDSRLTLLEMILEDMSGVLPILMEKLKDRQPWYVVRNCLILLGAIGDPDLYPYASAFLCHPDHRVQRQVITCIVALGGEEVTERFIAAFHLVNDDVKVSLIECLDDFDDAKIEGIYLCILEQRKELPLSVREDLVCRISNSTRVHHLPRVVCLLKDIVNESRYRFVDNDPVVEAVNNVLIRLENCDNLS
ncbi:HEAT repeat domain-containing protein [Desulforhopalus sp. IMCC35007]|uniref:HEAT repeat domain-containing protein n=1 Tax=Desulforhopalus sp. IMCC35007 TaxID=2569543 RepID=UPI0010ADE2A0|nr:HEAT repeat domain-containing protein [Desulforhopalus sp. IMCC35007]TKB05984.1 HEAT repeat domain-containing protein [Desulforhopalus sp. IMCC35007]